MRVNCIVGAIMGLVTVLNVLGQSNTVQQPQLSPATRAVLPLTADKHLAARDEYVGDDACGPCHREKIDTYHRTAHYLTSQIPDKNSILGKFTPNKNTATTSNPELLFRMEEKPDGWFQTAMQGIAPYTTERSERFGLVVGSGGKGQTYLFWKGDRLFQLPISYWTGLGWVNSPGYRDGTANFDRPIIPRCLECHTTYFEAVPPPPNRYRKTGFLVGITCEKCHGPGREHVHREGSEHSITSYAAILPPAKVSRDRQMDLCAWCHAGPGVTLAPAFSYLPGEPLDKYLELPKADPNAEIDVHGSQVELLEKSRCFQSSTMTCLTCHDVHTVQHDLFAFSQRCLGCHKPETSMFPKLGHQLGSNCIGCHMPMQETSLIVFDWNGRKARPQVRSHWIRVYRSAAQSK